MDPYRMMIMAEVGWLLFGFLLWAWWRERNLNRELTEVIAAHVLAERSEAPVPDLAENRPEA